MYLAVLSKTDPSPFAPESDEEKPGDAPRPEGAKAEAPGPESQSPDTTPPTAAKPDAPRPARVADVKIDWDKINQRILAMPLPARRYVQLQAGRGGTLFAIEAPAAPAATPGPGGPRRP